MKYILSILLISMLSFPAFAEKPADKGKGKPAMEYKQEHHEKAKDFENSKDKMKHEMSEKSNKDDKLNGLEKQKEMKMEQEQKELGKGSEQGQTAREEHRKKWWKFWE